MLTLSDINTMTNSKDGDIFSDLFKDVYGYRPRGTLAQFITVEEFDAEYERLVKQLSIQIDEDKIRREKNFQAFIGRVESVQELVAGTSRERAIEILADAEDEADAVKFYGYERLEWCFGLEFGSIKQWLQEAQ